MAKLPQILLLEYTTSKLRDKFTRSAQKAKVKIDFACWEDIIIDTAASQKSHYLLVKDKPVTHYDLIYLRTIKSRYYEMAQVSSFATHHGIRIVDRGLSQGNRIGDSKIHQLTQAVLHGLPIPRTVFATDTTLVKEADRFSSWPLVFKVMGLHRGQGIFLVKNKNQIKKLMDRFMAERESKNFILQEIIDYIKDYRIFVMGDKVLGAIQRIPKSGEFRANVSRGGSAKAIKDLPTQLEKMAIKAAKIMQLDIAGVDFLEDKAGNYYLLEINRAPQFKGFETATGIDVRTQILKYFRQLILSSKHS